MRKCLLWGFPVSSVLGESAKYTEGVVSALSGPQDAPNMFQMTIPIQPGNSGGAVVDLNGEVVGIVTSTAAVSNFYASTGTLPQNVNWAIKSEYLALLSPQKQESNSATSKEAAIGMAQNAVCKVEARM